MIQSQIDHIVLTVPTLEIGVTYVRRKLGVIPQKGGEHLNMGTHNCFVKLGTSSYLEIMSINPKAPSPVRPRWFELDKHTKEKTIQLATWIARTTNIQTAASASPVLLGEIEPMSRGDFNWQITIPKDGSMPLNGIAPSLIQWENQKTADTLKNMGCSLIQLEGFHPKAEKINRLLQSIGFNGNFSVSQISSGTAPYLIAHIETPHGERVLSSCGER